MSQAAATAAQAVIFRPQEIDFATLNEVISAGVDKIKGQTVCDIDLTDLKTCNTTAVCLLLELRRVALQENCELRIQMNTQLHKLLDLYRLMPWFSHAHH